eukprot:Nk52_evm2s1914 gene=Nk52_evmTU2s1914
MVVGAQGAQTKVVKGVRGHQIKSSKVKTSCKAKAKVVKAKTEKVKSKTKNGKERLLIGKYEKREELILKPIFGACYSLLPGGTENGLCASWKARRKVHRKNI